MMSSSPQIRTIQIPTPGGFASFCEIMESMAKSTTSSTQEESHQDVGNDKVIGDNDTTTHKLVGIPSEVSVTSTCASTTYCSSNSTNDSDSVSSISSCDDKDSLADDDDDDNSKQDELMPPPPKQESSSPRSPRSIFKDHWEKSGLEPMTLIQERNDLYRRHIMAKGARGPPRLPFEWEDDALLNKTRTRRDNDDDNTYEKTLKLQEGVTNSPSSSRRSIFSHRSEPTLFLHRSGAYGEIQGITSQKRTYSVPMSIGRQHQQPMASCLRTSSKRYTNNGKNSSTTNAGNQKEQQQEQHVAFSPKVSVMKYHIPLEEWGTKGWSEWFK